MTLDGESCCFQIVPFTSHFPLGTAISYTSAMCQNWQSAWQLLEEAPEVAQRFGRSIDPLDMAMNLQS